jgi:hypothetical protein
VRRTVCLIEVKLLDPSASLRHPETIAKDLAKREETREVVDSEEDADKPNGAGGRLLHCIGVLKKDRFA